MVFVAPSPADALLGELQGFAKNLQDRLMPNLEFQKNMQKAIGNNPGLIVELANLEKNSPGSLNALGFGKLGEIIAQTPDSITNQFQRENRGTILANQAQQLKNQSGQLTLDSDKIDRIRQMLIENPKIASDQIQKELTGQTSDQASESAAIARMRNAEADKYEAELPGVLAKAKLTNTQLEQTLQQFPQLSQYDPVRIARDMLAGKSIPNLANFLTLPGANEALAHAQTAVDLQQRLDQTAYLRAMYKQGTDAQEKAMIQNARAMQIKTGGTGTIDAWRTVLENPDQVDVIRKKLQDANGNFGALTQPERDVLHASDAQIQQEQIIADRQRIADQYQLTKGIQDARAQIFSKKGSSDNEANLALAPVNSALMEQAKQYGGEVYQARYGIVPPLGAKEGTVNRTFFHPGGGKKDIYYVDKNGVRVDDMLPFKYGSLSQSNTQVQQNIKPDVVGPPAPKTATNTPLSADAAQALTILNGMPAGPAKDAQIARMKAQRPEIYNQIAPRLK